MNSPFIDLGLSPALAKVLTGLGYEEPTPIQSQSIPPLLAGRDLLGQAATGTGKTAAFALPLLQRVLARKSTHAKPDALVLVPTRELAIQVAEALHSYGHTLGAVVLPIYGGAEFGRQVQALKRGVHVVVATPGRALDHIRRGTLALDALQTVVLDEADEMLDMGFAEDIELILEAAPESRQTALFSATLPPRIAAIADKHLRDPARVLIAREKAVKGTAPRVRQTAYIVQRAHKVAALGRVLDLESPTLAIVFARTRTEVDDLAEKLRGRGYQVEALHGGLSQDQRDRVMKRVRGPDKASKGAKSAKGGSVDLLVATDVAARGLDVEHLSHVVNFDVPASPESYVHRIGRTGRAGREGVAITLVEPREHRLLRNIEQLTKQTIDVATVPTPMDVRARRLDLTRGALRAALEEGELDSFRVVTDALASEFDPMDVAAAAVKLAHQSLQADAAQDDEHIPSLDPRTAREPWAKAGKGAGYGASYADKRGGKAWREEGDGRATRTGATPAAAYSRSAAAAPRRGAAGATAAASHPAKHQPAGARRTPHGAATMVRVFVGAGRNAGLRPADIVGAIANEAGVSAREIGAIEIEERFSLVEVSDHVAELAVQALRATSLRGQKVTVRRDQPKRATEPTTAPKSSPKTLPRTAPKRARD
ncbi:MAG: DEAD/DEAH box helicase [Burkholderiaceae bacterium]|nr:DEAD/DEAH box helicase [Burkholderiaceae bacterium]